MPSPTAVITLLKDSMRLAGVLATGETPTADEAVDGLRVLNDLLENWSTQPLAVWQTANEAFTTVPGQATYTIGPGGNFNTARPVRISGAFCTFGGVDFPVQVVEQGEFNGIGLKALSQPIVEELLYVNDVPLGIITLWPVPSQAVPLVLSTDTVIGAVTSTSQSLTLPPGGALALRYELAQHLAAEYGRELSDQVLTIAWRVLADYKRANAAAPVASFDPALTYLGR